MQQLFFMFVGLKVMYCKKYSWIAEVPANPDVKRLENGSQRIMYKKERKKARKKIMYCVILKNAYFFLLAHFIFAPTCF